MTTQAENTEDLRNTPAQDTSVSDEKSTRQVRQTDIQHYISAATSDNTRKAYRSAIRQFEKWGGRLPSHRDQIAHYLLNKATTHNPRTLDLHLTAISQWHYQQNLKDPTRDSLIRKTMEGIRRQHGRPKQKAKALRIEHITTMTHYLQQQPQDHRTKRDLALILIGFFAALRRSELVSIQVSDLSWEEEGLIIRLPKSKTDQYGKGLTRAIPFSQQSFCPSSALKDWLNSSGIITGPVFRPINRWGQIQTQQLNPAAVNELLKQLGKKCNFAFAPQLSSHSLRRGLSTSAAREGVAFEHIKKQGGWKSDQTVWEYIDESNQFSENASAPLIEKINKLLEG